MGGEANIDAVIHVRPFRVVVGTLGEQGDAAHEPERLNKIAEPEAAADTALVICQTPVPQFGQRSGALIFGQLGDAGHGLLLGDPASVRRCSGSRQAVTAAALSLRGLACRRGERLLFTGLDLDLAAGGSAQIAGPNGVGKSSLLRIIAGLLRPYAGTVSRNCSVALTDELDALDRDRTVHAALAFWAKMDEAPLHAIDAALEDLGIAHLAEIPVRMLSTGQRKRAALARTLASGAPIWLLDEPANGLDAQAAALLGSVVERHRTQGGIVLAASHTPLAWPQDVTLHLSAPTIDMDVAGYATEPTGRDPGEGAPR